MLFSTVGFSQDFNKNVDELFGEFPISKSIEAVVENSNLDFQHTLTIGQSGLLSFTSEYWIADLERLEWLSQPTKRIELELVKDDYLTEGCYKASLRIFFEDNAEMIEEFTAITTKFKLLGQQVEDEEDEDIEGFESVYIQASKNSQFPSLYFSIDKEDEENQLFINFQNCITPKK